MPGSSCISGAGGEPPVHDIARMTATPNIRLATAKPDTFNDRANEAEIKV